MKPQRIYHTLLLYVLTILLTTAAGRSYARSAKDTIPVFFGFNDGAMNRQATSLLDSLRYEEVLNPGKKLLIIGYADFVGAGDYNDKLSRERAQAVKSYLLTLGFHDANVQLCIGKGEVAREGMKAGPDGYAPDRRVDIVLLNSSMPPATTPPPPPEVVAAEKHFTGLKKDITSYTPQETFRLNNLYFYANKHYLLPGSESVLDTLCNILKAHPSIQIRVEGHICCVTDLPDAFDDDTRTYDLSVNRAKYIRNYLIKKGIQPQRVAYKGFGRKVPIIYLETTEEEAMQNRRVEIRILSQ